MNRRSLAVALAGAAVAGKGLISTVAAQVGVANTTFTAEYSESKKKLKKKGLTCDNARWEHSHQDTKFTAKGRCRNTKSVSKNADIIGILYVGGTEEKRCNNNHTIPADGAYHEFECHVTYNA